MNLETMNLTTLRREYHRVFGLATTSKRRRYLQQRIAARHAELARERARSQRDPRLPRAGTVLVRKHEGKTHRVKVTDVGFEYGRRMYPSLSAVAKTITGTQWNGFGFFHLLAPANAEERQS